jgi:hypothetical protein
MYSVVISPEHYSNNKIKVLIELYRTYNGDMSPACYEPEKVVFTKGILSIISYMIDSKLIDTNYGDDHRVFVLINKIVEIIKTQTNSLTDQEWEVIYTILERISIT